MSCKFYLFIYSSIFEFKKELKFRVTQKQTQSKPIQNHKFIQKQGVLSVNQNLQHADIERERERKSLGLPACAPFNRAREKEREGKRKD
uniref:Uncharacterized protein n=1 Tax=Rhizophora mucronata TaxID=61149 RepID=A0A2P2KPK1_RHIMU